MNEEIIDLRSPELLAELETLRDENAELKKDLKRANTWGESMEIGAGLDKGIAFDALARVTAHESALREARLAILANHVRRKHGALHIIEIAIAANDAPGRVQSDSEPEVTP